MPKFFCLVSLLLLCSLFPVGALDQRLSIGLIGGISTGSASGDDVDILYNSLGNKISGAISNGLVGGQVGLVLQYRLPTFFFAVQSEVMFLFNRGLSYSDAVNQAFEAKTSGNQVAFNLLLQGIVTTTEIISFSIFVGPTFSFPMGTFIQTFHDKKTGSKEDITFLTNYVTYGIVVGLGLQIDSGPGFFTIDGRFQMDFTPFSPQRRLSLSSPLTLQVGYSFYIYRENS